MNINTIKLEQFQTKGARVFAGRQRGRKVRADSRINELEVSSDKIIIELPENIGSLNPSFLEEFLFNVVTKLGPSEFNNKFEFKSLGRYNIKVDLEEAVDRIIKTQNALVI